MPSIHHPQNNGSSLSSLFATGDWLDWRQRWNSFRGQRGLIDRSTLAWHQLQQLQTVDLAPTSGRFFQQWLLFLAENLFFSREESECPSSSWQKSYGRSTLAPSSIQGLMPDILFTGRKRNGNRLISSIVLLAAAWLPSSVPSNNSSYPGSVLLFNNILGLCHVFEVRDATRNLVPCSLFLRPQSFSIYVRLKGGPLMPKLYKLWLIICEWCIQSGRCRASPCGGSWMYSIAYCYIQFCDKTFHVSKEVKAIQITDLQEENRHHNIVISNMHEWVCIGTCKGMFCLYG